MLFFISRAVKYHMTVVTKKQRETEREMSCFQYPSSNCRAVVDVTGAIVYCGGGRG